MKKTGFFFRVAIGILLPISFFSCSTKDKSDEIIKQMEESLINSNNVINTSTEATLKALNDKTTEPATRERAKIWYAKAERITSLSKEMYDYLETIKREQDEKKLSADTLNRKLLTYKEKILHTDSSIREQFSNNFEFVTPISKITTSSILISLQNSIKVAENKITAFCNSKVGAAGGWFEWYSPIAGQNSKYLKPGDELEISAGIGLYSKASNPIININGKNTEVGEEGYAIYKMKINHKPGQYKIPVKIGYFNQTTGKNETMEKNIEYTIIKPCN